MKSGVTVVKDELPSFLLAVKQLMQVEVLVGIPEENATRHEDLKAAGAPIVVNNAMIGYWMEFGVPSRNIPARTHLIPGVADAEKKFMPYLRKAAEAATRGDVGQVDVAMHSAGLIAKLSVQNLINSGIAPPLSDSTLAARRRRGRTGDVPLVDSGEYRNNITYVLKKK